MIYFLHINNVSGIVLKAGDVAVKQRDNVCIIIEPTSQSTNLQQVQIWK